MILLTNFKFFIKILIQFRNENTFLNNELDAIKTHLSEIGFHEDLQSQENPPANSSSKSNKSYQKKKELSLNPSKKIKILIEATKKLKLAFDEVVNQKLKFENILNDSKNELKKLERELETMKLKNKNLNKEIINLTKLSEKGVLSPEQVTKIFSHNQSHQKHRNSKHKKRGSEDDELLTDLLAENKIHHSEDDYKGKTYFTYNNEEDLIQNNQLNGEFDDFNQNYHQNQTPNLTTDWGIGIVPEVGRASLETTERHRTAQKSERNSETIMKNFGMNDSNVSSQQAFLKNSGGFGKLKQSDIRMTETSLDANFKEGTDVFIDFTKKHPERSFSPAESPMTKTEENLKEKVAGKNREARQSWNKTRSINEEKVRILRSKRNQLVKMLMAVLHHNRNLTEKNVDMVKFVNSTFREFEDFNKEILKDLKLKNKKINLLENQINLILLNNEKQPKSDDEEEKFTTPPSEKNQEAKKYLSNSSLKRQKNYIQTLEIERLEIENRWKKERIKVRELKRELKILYGKRGMDPKKNFNRDKADMMMYNSGGLSENEKRNAMKFSSSPPSDVSKKINGGGGSYVTPPPKNSYIKGKINIGDFGGVEALQSEGKSDLETDVSFF